MKIYPFKHQENAIHDILHSKSGLMNCDRATYISACGTGKTLTGMWISEYFTKKDNIIVLLFPSLSLVNQTFEEYKKYFTYNFNPIVVCSDEETINSDISPDEMKFKVSTNKEYVDSYVSNTNLSYKIIFTTYHSSSLVGDSLRDNKKSSALTIFDEAHKTATYDDTFFSYGLYDKNLPSLKRLFMTATPKHYSSEYKEHDLVFSMDNNKTYGQVVHDYTMKQGIKDGVITDYKIILTATNKSDIPNKYIHNKELVKLYGLMDAIEKTNSSKIICFTERIAKSKKYNRLFNDIFKESGFISNHIDGKTKSVLKKQIIESLTSDNKSCVFNAQLLTEGIDIPEVDMIALLEKSNSVINTAQRVGRVQRINKNKPNKIGYVYLPLNIDFTDGETIEEIGYKDSSLRNIWETLNIMQEVDGRLKDVIKYYSRSHTKDTKIIKKLEKFIEFDESTLKKITDTDFRTNLYSIILDGVANKWDVQYGKLKDFYNTNEHSRVRLNDDKSLHYWCLSQRDKFKKETLSNEQVSLLGEVEFIFDLSEELWEESYREILEFYRKNKHIRLDVDSALYSWVGNQRQNFKNGKLTEKKIKKLEDIGMVWNTFEEKWNDSFNEFTLNYVSRKTYPTQKESAGLWAWVNTQRRLFRQGKLREDRVKMMNDCNFLWEPCDKFDNDFKILKDYYEDKKSWNNVNQEIKKLLSKYRKKYRSMTKKIHGTKPLSQKEINTLKTIDFPFESLSTKDNDSITKSWREAYNRIKDYKKTFGNVNVAQDYIHFDKFKLGAWCENQRTRNKENKLNIEQIHLLNILSFSFSPQKDKDKIEWENFTQELLDYKSTYSDLVTGKKMENNNPHLSDLIKKYRRLYNEKKLPNERFNILDEIGLVIDVQKEKEKSFIELLEDIKLYVKKFGNLLFDEDSELRKKSNLLRQQYRDGKLEESKLNRLEEIKFRFDGVKYRRELKKEGRL